MNLSQILIVQFLFLVNWREKKKKKLQSYGLMALPGSAYNKQCPKHQVWVVLIDNLESIKCNLHYIYKHILFLMDKLKQPPNWYLEHWWLDYMKQPPNRYLEHWTIFNIALKIYITVHLYWVPHTYKKRVSYTNTIHKILLGPSMFYKAISISIFFPIDQPTRLHSPARMILSTIQKN